MLPVHPSLGAWFTAASSQSNPHAAAHELQPTDAMATPPPPRKQSVFMGRETLVDRDEVDK